MTGSDFDPAQVLAAPQGNRRSIRLPGYDYSPAGACFVTVCTQNRECLLRDIVNGEMRLNEAGRVVESVWAGLPGQYAHVGLDTMVMMPNHFHGMMVLTPVGAGFKPVPTPAAVRHGLSEIVRALKTISSRRINEMRQSPGAK